MENNDYVWYVCYGSNLAINRLRSYFDDVEKMRIRVELGKK